jgi:cytochrome o ubiquinol oxidase subunit 3
MNEAVAEGEKTIFGFWVYLMTDCVLFATLFATFAVLRHNTFGGPNGEAIFSLPVVLTETLILLTSSFTCGLGILFAKENKKNWVLALFGITFLLGAAFLSIELNEFHKLALEGRVQKSGLTNINVKRLTLLGLFWHFLDIIWIFIFTIVYMLGVI